MDSIRNAPVRIALVCAALFFCCLPVSAAHADASSTKPFLAFTPQTIEQGEPVLISVEGLPAPAGQASLLSEVKSISFGGRKLPMFLFNGKPSAFGAISLRGNPGKVKVSTLLSLPSGSAPVSALSATLVVTARPKIQAPLGIPDSLGGNTSSSQKKLVSSLASENKIIASLKSPGKALWTKPFAFPVADPVVTDPYGYLRQTGGYVISHLGTDFRAPPGTPVLAMNDGVVLLARQYRAYGNIIVIGHGAGVMTIYVHLSSIGVKEGQAVSLGEQIGLSGMTGYAEGPHLHLSVHVLGTSVDPMKFMQLMQ